MDECRQGGGAKGCFTLVALDDARGLAGEQIKDKQLAINSGRDKVAAIGRDLDKPRVSVVSAKTNPRQKTGKRGPIGPSYSSCL